MEKKIKNLLFDLGGVIIDIKRENCVAALMELGMKNAGEFLGDYIQKGPFLQLENGSISATQFRNEIRRHIPGHVTDEQIDNALGKFLIGIPVERLRMLEELHKDFKVYILSNTNPIMWEQGIKRFFEADGHCRDYYFDGEVASFKARCVKPDQAIFRYAIDHLGIDPEETLFFDDSVTNTEAAAKLGFKTMHVAPGKNIIDLLP